VTVEHGVVTEIFVELDSMQKEETQRGRTVITSKSVPAWNIRRYTAFNTGGTTRTSPTVEATLNPKWPHPNQDAALDFNLRCLGLGRSCSSCEILPRICEDDEHGQWFYFEMSRDLLSSFRDVVNELPMHCPEGLVMNRVGGGRLTSQALYDDKLPYRFPDGTVFGDAEPNRLIYYLKKRREANNDDPKDQKVTFVFDDEDRLAAIVSQADGIRKPRSE
jgi:hypothetical protein